LGKTVYTLVVVIGLVSSIQFVSQPPVPIGSIEFGIEITKLVDQVLVLTLPSTLATVKPFVIG